MICDRCGKSTSTFTTSYFNTEQICIENCKRREKAHPKYAEAVATEIKACQEGNFNFVGIGCPAELYEPEENVK